MATENPFKRPDPAEIGDTKPDTIYPAVGEALSTWENTERGFASIFAKVVAPIGSGFAARRAYGTIIANRVRREMIGAAAEVFFRNFPSAEAESELALLMGLYSTATGRRNDFAHGIIGGDVVKEKFWYFLVPNTWGSKSRDMNLQIEYRYSSAQIIEFKNKFIELGTRAFHLYEHLARLYREAPDRARAPY
jgi:hypothetical protein